MISTFVPDETTVVSSAVVEEVLKLCVGSDIARFGIDLGTVEVPMKLIVVYEFIRTVLTF
jgi:hypothetical protein